MNVGWESPGAWQSDPAFTFHARRSDNGYNSPAKFGSPAKFASPAPSGLASGSLGAFGTPMVPRSLQSPMDKTPERMALERKVIELMRSKYGTELQDTPDRFANRWETPVSNSRQRGVQQIIVDAQPMQVDPESPSTLTVLRGDCHVASSTSQWLAPSGSSLHLDAGESYAIWACGSEAVLEGNIE